ncbi:hypothetical protein WJ970_14640 [Achromobacter xylosoxidans]
MPTSASPSTRCSSCARRRRAQAEPAVSVRVDGTGYTAKGKLLFSDVSVDPGTGQVMLRGQFSNPDGLLLPGMYVRVSAEQGVQSNAIFVPQRAVMRGADGQAKVLVARRQGAGASGADRRHAGIGMADHAGTGRGRPGHRRRRRQDPARHAAARASGRRPGARPASRAMSATAPRATPHPAPRQP